MPLEVKKQESENARSLVRRFTRRLRQSGILRRAKEAARRERPKSKKAKKANALRKVRIKKEYEKMKKMGTLRQ